MAKVANYREMLSYIRRAKNIFAKVQALSLVELTQRAHEEALINARSNFTGRNDRKLSGRLLNAIYTEFDLTGGRVPRAFLGTKGIPYGAVHEYGHPRIVPVRAKHLWVKLTNKGDFRRLTPTEFFKLRNENNKPSKGDSDKPQRKIRFSIFRSKKGNLIAARIEQFKKKLKITPLFALKDQVKIPERPYLRPAIKTALNIRNVRAAFNKHLRVEIEKG